MHPQHTAFITFTLVTIMCSTPAKSQEPTENPSPSAEPTQDAAALSTGSMRTPRILRLMGLCTGDDLSFCINGQCRYHPDLSRPICRCQLNYGGERCELLLLDQSHSAGSHEKYIAIGGGLAVLLGSIAIVLYCCLKKRCAKEKPADQICHSGLAI